ncbi:hypothetical protein D3C80_851090 [compost metagenome]
MIDVEQLEIAVEIVGLQADGHALPGAAGEAVEVGRGARIALGTVFVQSTADLIADRDAARLGRRGALLQRQTVVALAVAADRSRLDDVFAGLRRGEDEVGVQPLAVAVVVLGRLHEGAADHASDTDQRIEVVGFQQDRHPIPGVGPEGVGVEGLAVFVLGVAAGQSTVGVVADRDAAWTWLARGHALAERQGVGAGLQTGIGARAHDIDAVSLGREAQAGVHAASGAVIVGRERLARGAAFGIDRQIGVEVAAAQFSLQPLASAELNAIVVIAIGLVSARAGVALLQPSANLGAYADVGRGLGGNGAGRQQGDNADRPEQGRELRMTHENLFAGAIIDAEPQRL